MRRVSLVILLVPSVLLGASPRQLALRKASLDLPAPPVAVVGADLDRDGRRDLLVILAYTEWSSLAEDRVEGAVQVTEVVPALFDRREARAFLADSEGGYRAAGAPLPLPMTVFSVEEGPPALPVLAFTEDGLSVFRLEDEGAGPTLSLRSVFEETTVLAGSETMLPGLDLVRDVDGDGRLDVLFPASRGLGILRGTADGLAPSLERLPAIPWRAHGSFLGAFRSYPLPRVEDVDGDGTRDLIVLRLEDTPQRIAVLRGAGGGRFHEAREIRVGCLGLGPRASSSGGSEGKSGPGGGKRIAFFGDVDGDGKAEVVTRMETDEDRGELKKMKEPRHVYGFHRIRSDLSVVAEPYQTLVTVGHPYSGDFLDAADENLRDLDGDGRKDLITVSFDFSVLQAVRVLTTKKMGIGVELHVYAQGKDGVFRLVDGQRLEEKLKLDLNRVKIGRMAQLAGDFDGDGRVDFVHLGRGREITIHRGEAGCRYPVAPDLTVPLDEEPQDIALVRIRDLDGDSRADIAITRPLEGDEAGPSVPVRLDLLLSGGVR